ncbi:hypothetical protein QTO34_001547 [Cnephaeus nilssonii]|uniref:Uncharacterized protein n=1 Tax=Cnephaeus nilssonii TaxID=3371016 RepID=A0AA40LLS6_CNENI|nr:hypothetical protein QTO34_001547 [Eptesicus nilssonii]
MVVLPLLLALALLVILYFRHQSPAAAASQGRQGPFYPARTSSATRIARREVRAKPITSMTFPPMRMKRCIGRIPPHGSNQQIGSGKDTGDIHYASFTHLEPFGLENPIYVNTRPGPKPTPDPFLDVEYASITKN